MTDTHIDIWESPEGAYKICLKDPAQGDECCCWVDSLHTFTPSKEQALHAGLERKRARKAAV